MRARRSIGGALTALLGSLLFASLFAKTAQADSLTDLEQPFSDALKSGSYGYALALIFGAGLATSLTPCVYPMIAITVSVFGASKTESRRKAAMLSTRRSA
jgi:thiol:disulfide interchange protein DsbD